IEKSGSWFSYAGDRLGQGRENAKQFLKEHPEIASKIDSEIRGSEVKLKPVMEEAEDREFAAG
ncbi:DNA recombination/repair protein RecA, partial [Paenibacillus lactis]